MYNSDNNSSSEQFMRDRECMGCTLSFPLCLLPPWPQFTGVNDNDVNKYELDTGTTRINSIYSTIMVRIYPA